MIRALTTLVGLACAAALLLLVTDTGSAEGGGLWKRAALFAAAGLVAGVLLPARRHPAAGRARQPAALPVRVRPVDAARARDLRAACGHAGFADRSRPRHPPGQRAHALVALVPDPRLRGRPAARVRARRAASCEVHAPWSRRGRGAERCPATTSRPARRRRRPPSPSPSSDAFAEVSLSSPVAGEHVLGHLAHAPPRVARRAAQLVERGGTVDPSRPIRRPIARSIATRLSSATCSWSTIWPCLRATSAPPRRASRSRCRPRARRSRSRPTRAGVRSRG